MRRGLFLVGFSSEFSKVKQKKAIESIYSKFIIIYGKEFSMRFNIEIDKVKKFEKNESTKFLHLWKQVKKYATHPKHKKI